jgi:hypothetical protein
MPRTRARMVKTAVNCIVVGVGGWLDIEVLWKAWFGSVGRRGLLWCLGIMIGKKLSDIDQTDCINGGFLRSVPSALTVHLFTDEERVPWDVTFHPTSH